MIKPLTLIGISGTKVGARLAFSGRSSIIGSAPGCQLVLHDRAILPRHAEVRMQLDRWFIVPLEAGAQIFINGERITSQNRILEGDLVTIGTATFKATLVASPMERAVG